MVEVIGYKLATHHPVIQPVSAAEPGTLGMLNCQGSCWGQLL